MINLQVSIEVNGVQCRAGTIHGDGRRKGTFSYDRDYLTGPVAVPLSVALPLQENPSRKREHITFLTDFFRKVSPGVPSHGGRALQRRIIFPSLLPWEENVLVQFRFCRKMNYPPLLPTGK